MKIIWSYIRSAVYNIFHNKIYSLFYILGVAITFIFIIIILQISHLVTHADPPFINAQRTIHINEFADASGVDIGGVELQDINNLLVSISGVEAYAISNSENINADINGKVRPVMVGFVNSTYFQINKFDFLSGRAFIDDANAEQQAIITEDIAAKYYQANALGKKISVQGIIYDIIGVVKNYSSLLNPYENANIWIPYKYNKFIPSGGRFYSIDVLFSKDIPLQAMKSDLNYALTQYFSSRGENINLTNNSLSTIQEVKSKQLGDNKLAYGTAIILFLLMLIPSINIMALSMANVYNRAPEIAMRRALGANKLSSFVQIIIENLLLVFLGLIIALMLIYPVFVIIEKIFFSTTYSTSILVSSSISWGVILVTILLAILFAILAGGIPAYNISNKNIANTLKGIAQ